MNIKPQIVRGLLRLYPAEWLTEYGEELGALLLVRPITSSVFVDVVLSATRERLKRDKVWKVCGIPLFDRGTAGAGYVIFLAGSPQRLNDTLKLAPVIRGRAKR